MTLGWGIVGASQVAEMRGSAIGSAHNVRLVGIADIDEARAEAYASKYGVKTAYASLSSLLQDPEVDIVYVATPNSLHAEQVIMAAEAKKHVLCEKPMALTVRDAFAMIEACRSNGVKLGVAFAMRHIPGSQFMRQAIREGKLGDPIQARIQRAYKIEKPKSGVWRTSPEIAGGGALMHQGVHLVDFLNYLFERRVVEISAIVDHERGEASVGPQEALINVLMRYEGGIFGIVVCSVILPNSINDLVVWGTTGRIIRSDNNIRIAREDRETSYNIPADRDIAAKNMVESFTRSVEEDSEWEGASGYDGLRGVNETLAIYESAKTGKTVKVKYSF
jgi:1,5-anhydro-D-fructose reductase (1,5-anhydro-D-mannitol-forming)